MTPRERLGLPLLPVTIVGSLPRPHWLGQGGFITTWTVPAEDLREALDDAVTLATLDQERAGLHIVTDGEQRRDHFINGFLRGLGGFDFETLLPRRMRGDRYEWPVPAVIGPVEWRGPVMLAGLEFMQQLTRKPVKVTLPGPMTVVDTVRDLYYGDNRRLARDVAIALNQEARALSEAGASVVQFDEPCFNIYLDDVEAWGIDELERALDGVTCVTAIHVCYGYGGTQAAAWKKRNTDWTQYQRLLPLLQRSSVQQLSLEFAMPRLDLSVLALARGKDILLGAIDTAQQITDGPLEVAARLRTALKYVPADRLWVCTDCGMAPIRREVARQKMAALAEAAAIVRAEYVRT